MQSCVYEGHVVHARRLPVVHGFRNRHVLLGLDLAELDEVFRGRWLWSTRRPSVFRVRRSDHLHGEYSTRAERRRGRGSPAPALDICVRDLVEQRCGRRPGGRILLLTQPRMLGFGFNPVSFYFVLGKDHSVESVLAEITNTPWGEQFTYVLPRTESLGESQDGGQQLRFVFDKRFHISPYMDMPLRYDWTFSPPGESLSIHMRNLHGDETLFDVQLNMRRRPLTTASLTKAALLPAGMGLRVLAGIYWQALRLKLKGVPTFDHPGSAPVSVRMPGNAS